MLWQIILPLEDIVSPFGVFSSWFFSVPLSTSAFNVQNKTADENVFSLFSLFLSQQCNCCSCLPLGTCALDSIQFINNCYIVINLKVLQSTFQKTKRNNCSQKWAVHCWRMVHCLHSCTMRIALFFCWLHCISLYFIVLQSSGEAGAGKPPLAALPTLLWNSARNWSSHSALHTEL